MTNLYAILDVLMLAMLIIFGLVLLFIILGDKYKVTKSKGSNMTEEELIRVYERDFAQHDDGRRIFCKVTGWTPEKFNLLLRTYGHENN